MRLDHSSYEELDVTGVEAELTSDPISSLAPTCIQVGEGYDLHLGQA